MKETLPYNATPADHQSDVGEYSLDELNQLDSAVYGAIDILQQATENGQPWGIIETDRKDDELWQKRKQVIIDELRDGQLSIPDQQRIQHLSYSKLRLKEYNSPSDAD